MAQCLGTLRVTAHFDFAATIIEDLAEQAVVDRIIFDYQNTHERQKRLKRLKCKKDR